MEVYSLQFEVDGSKAAAGTKEFQAALVGLSSTISQVDREAKAAFNSLKASSTGTFSKLASDINKLSGAKINPLLASEVQKLATALNSIKGNAAGASLAATVRGLSVFTNSAKAAASAAKALKSATTGIKVPSGMSAAASGISKFASTTRGATGALNPFRSAINATNFSHFTSGAKSAGHAVSALEHHFSLAAQSGNVFRNLIGAFTLSELISKVYEVGNKFATFKSAMTSAAGSAKGAADELNYLEGAADRLGSPLESIIGQYGKFAAAARTMGVSAEATRGIFEGLSTAGTVLGLDAQKMGRLFYGGTEMLSKNSLSMEQLRRQFGDALPGAFQKMEKALQSRGVIKAGENLSELVKQGKISGLALEALSSDLLKEYGSQLPEAMKRPSAQFAILSNQVVKLFETIQTSGVGEAMAKQMRGIASILSSSGAQDAAKRFGQALTQAVTLIGEGVQFIMRNAGQIAEVMKLIVGYFTVKSIFGLFKGLGAEIAVAMVPLRAFSVLGRGLGVAFTGSMALIRGAFVATAAVVRGFSLAITGITAAFELVRGAVVAFSAVNSMLAISIAATTVAQTIGNITWTSFSAAVLVATGAVSLFDLAMSGVSLVLGAVVVAAGGLALAFGASFLALQDYSGIWKELSSDQYTTMEKLQALWETIKIKAKDYWDYIKPELTSFGTQVATFFGDFTTNTDTIGTVWRKVFLDIFTFSAKGLEMVYNAAITVKDVFHDIKAIPTAVGTVIGNFDAAVVNVAGAGVQGARGHGKDARNSLGAAWDNVKAIGNIGSSGSDTGMQWTQNSTEFSKWAEQETGHNTTAAKIVNNGTKSFLEVFKDQASAIKRGKVEVAASQWVENQKQEAEEKRHNEEARKALEDDLKKHQLRLAGNSHKKADKDTQDSDYSSLLSTVDPAAAAIDKFKDDQNTLVLALADGTIKADQFDKYLKVLKTDLEATLDKPTKLADSFNKLKDSLIPADKSQEEFDKGVKTLDESQKAGLITMQQEATMLDLLKDKYAGVAKGANDMKDGFQAYIDTIKSSSEQMSKIQEDFAGKFVDSFSTMIETGKADWKGLVDFMLNSLIHMLVQRAFKDLFDTKKGNAKIMEGAGASKKVAIPDSAEALKSAADAKTSKEYLDRMQSNADKLKLENDSIAADTAKLNLLTPEVDRSTSSFKNLADEIDSATATISKKGYAKITAENPMGRTYSGAHPVNPDDFAPATPGTSDPHSFSSLPSSPQTSDPHSFGTMTDSSKSLTLSSQDMTSLMKTVQTEVSPTLKGAEYNKQVSDVTDTLLNRQATHFDGANNMTDVVNQYGQFSKINSSLSGSYRGVENAPAANSRTQEAVLRHLKDRETQGSGIGGSDHYLNPIYSGKNGRGDGWGGDEFQATARKNGYVDGHGNDTMFYGTKGESKTDGRFTVKTEDKSVLEYQVAMKKANSDIATDMPKKFKQPMTQIGNDFGTTLTTGTSALPDLKTKVSDLGTAASTANPDVQQLTTKVDNLDNSSKKAAQGTNSFGDGISGLLSKLGGSLGGGGGGSGLGGNIGGQVASSLGSLFGFAEGGSMTVGGSGGADTKLAAFKVTPGERIDIKTPAQMRAEDRSRNGYLAQGQTSKENLTSQGKGVSIVNVMHPSMAIDAMNSANGREVTLNHIKANKNAVRQLLKA